MTYLAISEINNQVTHRHRIKGGKQVIFVSLGLNIMSFTNKKISACRFHWDFKLAIADNNNFKALRAIASEL